MVATVRSVDGEAVVGGHEPPVHDVTAARALSIEGLHKRFDETIVLDGIDVAMAPGEFLVLVGPSGCGKSTLLNCIAGLEEISAGRLEIAGRDVTRVPPRERDIAMVFQSYALYPTMSIADNIGFGMRVRRVPKERRRAKIAEVAELLQIGHLLDRKPAQLSGGQRQRVAMGRALVRDPALFLFDEPLSNLDAKLRVEMRAEIKRVHQSTGASIVYVTHDQIEAMTLATRIVVLKGGVVQQIATPEEIYDRPANTFVADFMGSPPMNLVPARVVDGGEALAFGIADDDGTLSGHAGENGGARDAGVGHGSEASSARAAASPGEGPRLALALPEPVRALERVVVGVRPEAFSRDAGSGPALEIAPTMIENAGADAYIAFALGGRSLTARLSGRFDGAIGEPVRLALDTAHLCFFEPDGGTLVHASAPVSGHDGSGTGH